MISGIHTPTPGKRQRALAGNVADVNAVHHIIKHIDQLGGYCG